MKKLAIGLLVILLLVTIVLWQAPARLATRALAQGSAGDVNLIAPQGTLWNGAGQLLVNGELIGDVAWQFAPSRLLALEAAVHWQVRHSGYDLEGLAALDLIGAKRTLNMRGLAGVIRQSFLRTELARYDIVPAGDLTIDQLDITDLQLNAAGNWPQQIHAEGSARWTGGPVNYRLAGSDFSISMPPVLAQITTLTNEWPKLEVTEQATGALLMTGRLTPTGSAAIGVTRGLTRLTGQPWPGSEPDHAVVLEVEEQLI